MSKIRLPQLYFYFFVLLLVFAPLSQTASAESTIAYTNDEGVQFTEEDLTRFEEMGYDMDYLSQMSKEMYEENKGVYAVETTTSTEYIKTTYTYDESSIDENGEPEITNTISTELDRITFDTEVKALKNNLKIDERDVIIPQSGEEPDGEPRPPGGGGLPTSDSNTNNKSSYKKLTMKITKKSNGLYSLKSTMEWKIIPKIRGKDILAIGWDVSDKDFVLNRKSVYASQYYYASNYTSSSKKTYHYTLAEDQSSYDLSSSAVAVVQNLKNDIKLSNGSTQKVKELKQQLYFDVDYDKSKNRKYVTAESGYKHNIKRGSSVSLDSFTVGFNATNTGAGGTLSFTYKLKSESDKFDTAYKSYSQLQIKN